MTSCARSGWLIAALALAPGSFAQTAAEAPLVLESELAFVIGSNGVEPADEATLYPGELVGLALTWPSDEERPAEPRLEIDRSRFEPDQPRPRRLVPADPRAAGRDVIEILLSGVGEVDVPALTISDGTNVIAETEPFTLTVSPKLVEGQEPAPARGPRSIGLDTLGLAMVVGAALLVTALLGALIFWLARRERLQPQVVTVAEPAEPADERALRELDELLGSGLLERDQLKPFGIRLAEIGKFYFGALGATPLRERTTYECKRQLENAGLPYSRIHWLMEWLERIDLVKFAGDRPAADVMRDLAGSLRSMIEKTRGELHGEKTADVHRQHEVAAP